MATDSSILAWENPMGRGVWRARIDGVTKESGMTEQLNNIFQWQDALLQKTEVACMEMDVYGYVYFKIILESADPFTEEGNCHYYMFGGRSSREILFSKLTRFPTHLYVSMNVRPSLWDQEISLFQSCEDMRLIFKCKDYVLFNLCNFNT